MEGASRQAVNLGQRIGSQQYSPYSGDRVAELSENERRGITLAREGAQSFDPYAEQAGALIERGSQQFTDADMSGYMNPYIKGALDPAAREIREQGRRTLTDLDARSASMGAFGGSRAALMRTEAERGTTEAVSDLYQRGLSDAFDRATQLWGADRARDMEAAGQLMNLGQAVQGARTSDIQALMTTGATDRSIQQAMADFDYQQFVEERDWDIRNLSGLLASLQGTKGSYSTTQTTETEQKSDPLGQALGIAAMALGAMYGGPAGAAAGASVAGAAGAGTGGWADQAVAAGVS